MPRYDDRNRFALPRDRRCARSAIVRRTAKRRGRSLLADLANAPCQFAPAPVDRPLALYGAGNLGRLARDFLKRRSAHDFVDGHRPRRPAARATIRIGGTRGFCIPADVRSAQGTTCCLAVSVATSPYVPLERSLSDMGFEHVVPFYDLAESFRHLHPLSNGWFAPPLTAQDQDSTAAVLAGWADDTSRAHHLQFLAWRRLREEWTFDAAPVTECARFFIPEVAQRVAPTRKSCSMAAPIMAA